MSFKWQEIALARKVVSLNTLVCLLDRFWLANRSSERKVVEGAFYGGTSYLKYKYSVDEFTTLRTFNLVSTIS